MRRNTDIAMAAAAICAALAFAVWPQAHRAASLLAAQDDPAALADARIDSALAADRNLLTDQIEAALAADDAELAGSFVELAAARRIDLPDALKARVAAAVAEKNSALSIATRFATGFVTGNADDVASLSGTVAGDLFVFGDVRDVVREGKRLAFGEDADRLILGLAAAGLAITAATYVSVGGAAPVRAGLTLVKDARKAGRIGEGLTQWTSRAAREVIDAPALQSAVAGASLARPGPAITAVKAAFRTDRADGLVRLARDVGRVGDKAGTRGAFETLRIAQGPKDVARAARLAEAKGGQTRAIFKLLGRGALFLGVSAFNLSLWLVSALLAGLGFLASIKAMSERATQAAIDRGKARRARRQLAQRQRQLVAA